MTLDAGIKLHNYFDIELIDAKTGICKQRVHAENVVTNIGYNRITQLSNDRPFYNIAVGTGTGTPSATDTDLFQRLTYGSGTRTISVTDGSHSTCTLVVEFTENQANGVLTEVAAGYYYSSSYTSTYEAHSHAMFTDSEGHQIQITKTNADRLTITATIYLTLTYAESTAITFYKSLRSIAGTVNNPTTPEYTSQDSIGLLMTALWNGISSWYMNVSPNTLPTISTHLIQLYTSVSYTSSTRLNRLTSTSRILGDEYNQAITYEIRSIAATTSSWPALSCSFPNHTVYPPKLLELTQIGDGVKTDFNTGIPNLMTTDVEVYINDVLQSPSTYTFNGSDYTNPMAWKSYDTTYITKLDGFNTSDSSSWNTRHRGAFPFHCFRCPEASDWKIYYDFKTDYTVSAVGNHIPYSSFSTFGGVPTLWYSNDNTNWTQVSIPNWTDQTSYLANTRVTLSSAITARYWCVISKRNYIVTDSISIMANVLFGNPTPQLHFNTAPALDATITIKAYCEYPIKNANWIIEDGLTFDVIVSPTS